MTAIVDAFLRAGRAQRQTGTLSREAEEIVRRASSIATSRKKTPNSRFHILPEPQRREDLRLIELTQD